MNTCETTNQAPPMSWAFCLRGASAFAWLGFCPYQNGCSEMPNTVAKVLDFSFVQEYIDVMRTQQYVEVLRWLR
jgi:hypothetical protein